MRVGQVLSDIRCPSGYQVIRCSVFILIWFFCIAIHEKFLICSCCYENIACCFFFLWGAGTVVVASKNTHTAIRVESVAIQCHNPAQ